MIKQQRFRQLIFRTQLQSGRGKGITGTIEDENTANRHGNPGFQPVISADLELEGWGGIIE
jgi:hypothetical protein